MKQKHILLTLGAFVLLGLTSCKNKDLFNKEIYDEMVDFKFMVDNMDRSHDWQLIKNSSVIVKAPDNVSRLQVLTADPYSSPNTEIAVEAGCVDGQATLNYSIPIIQDMLYLAALASDGSYLGVVSFQYGTQEIDLRGVTLQNSGQLRTISPQTFSYLYEANFPEPDDFDYNDLVLRISKHYTSDPTQVLLTVKVDAVGIQKQVAAAIQLAGFTYEDVASVSILEGDIMDKDYPLPRRFINSDLQLMRGRSGQAVLVLFEDAHWVMLKEKESDGSIFRRMLNTSKIETENYSSFADPVTTTFCLNFKSAELAQKLTFDKMDPFIIEEYNGGLWEIHTYSHKFDEVLKDIYHGQASAYDNHVSWCVTVPKGDFRYPIEGMSLGTYSSETGSVFGPYGYFPRWMQNHTSNLDWYLNPTIPQQLY